MVRVQALRLLGLPRLVTPRGTNPLDAGSTYFMLDAPGPAQ